MPRLLWQAPFTQKPQSQSASELQLSAVQPWGAASVGAVQRVFSSQDQPSLQGIFSHPWSSARAESTLQRESLGHS
jgi:hypothetical protein